MKVLLLQDVKKLGKKMEVVEVSDGYARNFLIPQKIAVMADAQALKQQAAYQKQKTKKAATYQQMADKLKSEALELRIKVGAKGELFESINKERIKTALQAKGYQDFAVILPHPLKSLGDHKVEIKFPQGVRSEVLVQIKKAENA